MFVNIGPRKAGGVWLALIVGLGVGLMLLAIPAAGKERAAVQTSAGAHPLHAGLPNRDTNFPNWPGPRSYPILQACGGNPYLPSYGLLPDSSIGTQTSAFPWSNSEMQGTLDGPDVMSWYGYNGALVAWWSYYSNLNPVLGSCGGFPGWWAP